MVNGVLWRKVLRDLWQRKGGLATLLAIIAVGVGAYVGMAGVWRDLDGARNAYYRDYRLADFKVTLKRVPAWAVEEASGLPNIRVLRGRISETVLIDLPGIQEPIAGTALSLPATRQPVLDDVLLREGSWFSGRHAHEVILNDAFARAHGLRPGDRIKVLLLDKQWDLLIVGTAMSPEFVYLIPPDGGLAPDPARFGVLYLTQEFLRQSSDLQGAYNELLGEVFDRETPMLANTLQLLADRLDAFGVTQTTEAVNQPSVRFLHDELLGLRVQSRVMPAIFLGVAALVLNILMARLVAQQRTIIGTLRALGYASGTLTRHYMAYGLVIGAAGGLCGIALGLWLQGAMVRIYHVFFALPDLRSHTYWDIALIGVAISLAAAAAGTLKGVRGAIRLQPADAMRPPPPERGGRVLPERITVLWHALPFRWKMILRTVFRNPFRSTVSVIASVVATALVFAALSMVDALDYLMHYEFEEVAHQDLTIALRDPKPLTVKQAVDALPGVALTEPQLSVACDLQNGPYRKRIGITGLPPGAVLYTPLSQSGQPITVPERGLILADKLAEILHLRPGDTVRLRPLIGRRTEVETVVAGTVDTFLGLAAYADLRYLSQLLGENEVANVVLADTFQKSAGDALLKSLKRRPAVIGISQRRRALEQLDKTFGDTMGAMIAVLVLFSGTIAFGSVLNAILASLSERQREVGTLRVLGYSPLDITRVFAGESYLLNGLGVALGLYAGIGLAYGISSAYSTELYRFPTVILPGTLLLSALLMLVFISLAQLVVFRLVSRLDWRAVLNVRE